MECVDVDGCAQWGEALSCPPGSECDGGVCCQHDCLENAKGCNEHGQRWYCGQNDSDSCLDKVEESCSAGSGCIAGDCVEDCNECELGEFACQDIHTRWVCGDADNNGCLEKTNFVCPDSEICDWPTGECSSTCVSNCEQGQIGCEDNRRWSCELAQQQPQACWLRQYVDCGNQICAAGTCCDDQCDQAGQRRCSADGTQVLECSVNADGCLVPESVEACSHGVCVNDTATCCSHGCPQVGRKRCSEDGFAVIECILRTNGCLQEQQAISCDNGLCVAGVFDCCTHDCQEGEGGCISDGTMWQCVVGQDGCFERQNDDCDADQSCTGQSCQCKGPCIASTQTGCVNEQSRFECRDEDNNGCFEQFEVTCAASDKCAEPGICVPRCIDDQYEENNTLANAAVLTEGVYPSLILCEGDHDWYRITVPSDQRLQVMLEHDFSAGDINATLYYLDEQGVQHETQIASSTQDLEILSGALRGKVYLLHVYGASDQVQNEYNLTLAYDRCFDRFEPNDDDEQITDLMIDEYDTEYAFDLVICPGDRDYFSLEGVADGDRVEAFALFDHEEGNLEILLARNGTLTDGSLSQTDDEMVMSERGVGEVWLLLFGGDAEVENEVRLVVRKSRPGVTCLDDMFEPNDSMEQAYRLWQPGMQTKGKICANNDDWYSFELGADEGVRISVESYFQGNPDFNLEIFDQTGERLDASHAPDSEAIVTLSNVASGVYWFRVWTQDQQSSWYMLQVTPMPAGQCVDDTLEDNDTSDSARSLNNSQSYSHLVACSDLEGTIDEDWFRVTSPSADQQLRVTLEYDYLFRAEQLVQYEVWSDDTEPPERLVSLPSAWFVGGYLSYVVSGHTAYKINVKSQGKRYPYRLSFVNATPDVCLDDPSENNDIFENATLVPPAFSYLFARCSGDEDYLKLNVTGNEVLDVRLFMVDDDQFLHLCLYDDRHVQVACADTGTEPERQIFLESGVVPGTYYVRVFRADHVDIDYYIFWAQEKLD